ncbi:MAG: hypothetical protein GYB64_19910, partial [Chloroflexi bacterium]|nr:hypothetical protein [Chloroflexota bacterium]
GSAGPFRYAAPVDTLGGIVGAGLHITPDGAFYAWQGERAFQLSEGIFQPVFEGGTVIGVDDAGRVFAFDGETALVDDGVYGPAEGWAAPTRPGFTVRPGLVADGEGSVWVATSEDVRAFDGDSWTVYTPESVGMRAPQTDGENRVSRFVLAFDGANIWVGECTLDGGQPDGGIGARWFDGETWQGNVFPTFTGCVTAIDVGPDGRVWFDVDITVYDWNPETGVFLPHEFPQTVPNEADFFGVIEEMPVGPGGKPYRLKTLCDGGACDAGRIRYYLLLDEDNTWVPVTENRTRDHLIFSESGRGWLFLDEGVFTLSQGATQSVVGLMVTAAAFSPDGDLYVIGAFGSQAGLWVLEE